MTKPYLWLKSMSSQGTAEGMFRGRLWFTKVHCLYEDCSCIFDFNFHFFSLFCSQCINFQFMYECLLFAVTALKWSTNCFYWLLMSSASPHLVFRVCVCVCVCVSVCACVCVSKHTCTHTHNLLTHTHTIFWHTHTHTHTHIHTHTHTVGFV